MALLIDTDLLIDLERRAGTPAVEESLGDEERAISVITVSELLHGALRATEAQRTRRQAFVEYLLGALRVIPNRTGRPACTPRSGPTSPSGVR